MGCANSSEVDHVGHANPNEHDHLFDSTNRALHAAADFDHTELTAEEHRHWVYLLAPHPNTRESDDGQLEDEPSPLTKRVRKASSLLAARIVHGINDDPEQFIPDFLTPEEFTESNRRVQLWLNEADDDAAATEARATGGPLSSPASVDLDQHTPPDGAAAGCLPVPALPAKASCSAPAPPLKDQQLDDSLDAVVAFGAYPSATDDSTRDLAEVSGSTIHIVPSQNTSVSSESIRPSSRVEHVGPRLTMANLLLHNGANAPRPTAFSVQPTVATPPVMRPARPPQDSHDTNCEGVLPGMTIADV